MQTDEPAFQRTADLSCSVRRSLAILAFELRAGPVRAHDELADRFPTAETY